MRFLIALILGLLWSLPTVVYANGDAPSTVPGCQCHIPAEAQLVWIGQNNGPFPWWIDYDPSSVVPTAVNSVTGQIAYVVHSPSVNNVVVIPGGGATFIYTTVVEPYSTYLASLPPGPPIHINLYHPTGVTGNVEVGLSGAASHELPTNSSANPVEGHPDDHPGPPGAK